MKLVDKFLQKVGADKVLHFTIAALITAWGGNFGDIGLMVGALSSVSLSYIKERLDTEFCNKDLLYSMGGIISSCLIYLLNI